MTTKVEAKIHFSTFSIQKNKKPQKQFIQCQKKQHSLYFSNISVIKIEVFTSMHVQKPILRHLGILLFSKLEQLLLKYRLKIDKLQRMLDDEE